MKIINLKKYGPVLLIATVGLFASCGTQKDLVYFDGLKDSTVIDSVYWKPTVIRKGDQLSITVSSLNPDLDNLINKTNTISGAGGGELGYFVDENGNLNLPRVGRIYVEGMTPQFLGDSLQVLYADYARLPIVSVRLLNFRLLILGEVGRPGELKFANPRVDLFQALSLAGDIRETGKKSNILLIRQTDSSRIVHRIDMTDPLVIASPLFQLQSGDLIYVEPNLKKKTQSSYALQLLGVISGGLSFVAITLSLISRF